VRIKKTGYQSKTAIVANIRPDSVANITIVVSRYVRYVLGTVSLTVG
jgi:hypothetical protein